MKLRQILVNDEGKYFLFSPFRGRHYLLARGNTSNREIFLDSSSPTPLFPFSILIPFFEEVHRFKFTWKSLMTEEDAIKRELKPLLTYEKNVKESGESDDVAVTQKMVMVTRTKKDQYYLLDREIHPFDITILSADSSDLKFVFTFTLRILDMNKILADFPEGNMLQVVENMIITELNCALRKLKLQELRGSIKDGIRDDVEKIKKKLNPEFHDHGFELLKVMNEAIIVLPSSRKRIEAEQGIEIEKSTKKVTLIKADATAKSTIKTRTAEIEMKKMEGMAEARVLDQKLRNLYQFRVADKKEINLTQKEVSKNLGSTIGVVVLGNGSGLESDDKLISNIIANSIQTNQEGGGHA